jgi:hypothetical protein
LVKAVFMGEIAILMKIFHIKYEDFNAFTVESLKANSYHSNIYLLGENSWKNPYGPRNWPE